MNYYDFTYKFFPYLVGEYLKCEVPRDVFYTKDYWKELINDTDFDWNEIDYDILENSDEVLMIVYTIPKETEAELNPYAIYTPYTLLSISGSKVFYFTLERSISRDEEKKESWFVGLFQNGHSRVNLTPYIGEINGDSFSYFISRVTRYDDKLEKVILDYNKLAIINVNFNAKKQLDFLSDEELMKYISEHLNQKFIKHSIENSLLLLRVFQGDLSESAVNSNKEYPTLLHRIVDIFQMNFEATIKYCLENHSNSWFKLKKINTKNFLKQLESNLKLHNLLLPLIREDLLKNRLQLDINKINNLQQALIR
jgi:hypothetical protein